MNQQIIDVITRTFHFVKWVEGSIDGIPGKGWFLLEISPLPPYREVADVVADIHHDRDLKVMGNGQVRHIETCHENHTIAHNLGSFINKTIRSLKQQTFQVALHPGIPGAYYEQPLAIALDPVINYERYPDHPHLNVGNPYLRNPARYIPDSICYTDDIPGLGDNPESRLTNAIAYVVIWIFRHMFWKESKKYQQHGVWIGPVSDPLKPSDYITALNPNGFCRCGKLKPYRLCHLPLDIESTRSKSIPLLNANMAQQELLHKMYWSINWDKLRKQPQTATYTELNHLLWVASGS